LGSARDAEESRAKAGRLGLDSGDAADDCWIAAADAELIETDACAAYLLVGRPARIEHAAEAAVEVAPGLYQVIKKRE